MSHQIGDMVISGPLEYNDGRTVQAYKDECDVNKILAKFAKAGTLSHLAEYQGEYGDFSDFDFMEAQLRLARSKEIFEALPGEVQKEFGHNPANFFQFVADKTPAELEVIMPQLAESGLQMPDIERKLGSASAPPVQTAEPSAAEAKPEAPQTDLGAEG